MKKQAENPYLTGRKEYAERYADHIKEAHNWRLFGMGSILAALLAIGGLIAVSLQHKVVPYVVELNGHSEPVRVVRADVMSEPTTNQIKASLRSFIIGARTVYGDSVAQKNQLDTTYSMITMDSPAYHTMAAFHSANNPYERAQKETVEVTVNAIVANTADTWQIEWTEITKNRAGRIIDTKAWQGSFTVAISPPTNDKQILENPLGLYVKTFAWTTRL